MDPESKSLTRTYEFESPNHGGTVLLGLEWLRQKKMLFDVTLCVEGCTFPAHRVVLASCSDYFRAMFTDAMKERWQDEVCLNGVTALGLQNLLDYAYTSRLTLTEGNIQSVLGAASHLTMVPAVEACADFLCTQLDLTNCVDIANLADTYSLTGLECLATRYMARHLDKLACLPDFQRLSGQQLIHLLASNYPANCSEAEILSAVFTWLNYSLTDREAQAIELLMHIHFKNISGEECVELLQSHNVRQVCDRLAHVREYLLAMLCWSALHVESVPEQADLINPRGFERTVVTVGGFTAELGLTNSLAYLNPSTRTWKTLTTIPHVEQCNYGVAVLHNEIYVIGGCFNQSLQENIHPFGFRYDTRNDTWTAISPMLRERCRFYLASNYGYLHAIGGAIDGDESEINEGFCERYTVEEDRWLEVASIPCNTTQHAGATIDHCIYICGGIDCDFILSHLWCYDIPQDTWYARAPMLVPRVDHCMIADWERLYIAGGCRNDDVSGRRIIVDTVDMYDTETDQWQTLTRLPTPRYLASMVVIEGMLDVIGGFCHSEGEYRRATKKIERYNLYQKVWKDSTDYPLEIWEHVSVPMYVPTCRDDRDVEPPSETDC